MPDEVPLREKAREGIRNGRLPTKNPSRTYGGPGAEKPCALCGEIVTRQETEFEIEFSRHGVDLGFDRYHFHPRCFAAWEFERTKVNRPSA